MRIGLISDTHGLLRPEAIAFLRGCDHILHAGDIGSAEILEQLARIAPVTAVRGNNDTEPWAQSVREAQLLHLAGVGIYVLHDVHQLKPRDLPDGARVVVSGHSHKPSVRQDGGVLYVNPGSAGPRRFTLPISVGELLVDGRGGIQARLKELTLPKT
jgi:putative phosphoesterase